MRARTLVATAITTSAAFAALPLAHAQTPPPGFAPAPPSGSASATAPAPPPGYAPYPYPYPYPYPQPYAAPPTDWEKASREAARSWEPGAPVPEGYRVTTGVRKGLVVGGSVLMGSLWLINVLVAATLHEDEGGKFDPLYAPVAGPFIAIGTTRSESLGTFTLVVDGVAQAGGLAMLVAGLASTQVKLERDIAGVRVTPVPFTPDRATAGLGFVGSF